MFFVSAAFLAGLALVAVPWWLHRLNAHAAERQTVSSLFLMRPSSAPVNLRKKVQHLLLMALRWLLVITACLAFAEPMIKLAGSPTETSQRVPHQLIVLDTSLSMNSAPGGTSTMERAKAKARQLVASLPTGARAAVVSVADQIELVAPLTNDRSQLNAAIAATEAGAARLLLSGLIGRVTNLGETLAAPGERLVVRLISDFQASAMPDQFNALVEGSVWPLSLHPIRPTSDSNGANWAIGAMRHVPAEGAARGGKLEVSVRGYGTDATTLTVSLEQNDRPAGAQQLLVPANGNATAIFELEPAARGAATWTAQLAAADGLTADNVRRHVQVDAQSISLPVLSDSERASAYLRVAVQAAAPRFSVSRVTRVEDSAAPTVVVIDAGELQERTERALADYLASGGAVFMTAGPATRAAGRVAVLELALSSNRFAQAPRGAVAEDQSHPVLTGFGAWRDVTVFQTVKTAEEDGQQVGGGGEVILRLDDGTPLLVEYRVGAGRLMFLTTALDPAWSSLVVRPAFVDFTANVLGYLAEDLLPAEALVGQPFAIPAHSAQLFDASGERVLGLAQTVDRPTVSLAAPGVYELRTPSSSRFLTVNTDPAESDLATAPADLLERWQAASTRASARVSAKTNIVNSNPVLANQAAPNQFLQLAPWLLALLALIVFTEPVLANTGLLQRRTDPVGS